MSIPIRSTLLFGLISGTCSVPILVLLSGSLGWGLVLKLFLLIALLAYTLLLCRWSTTQWSRVIYPLLLVSAAALWPTSLLGFLLIALAVLSWIRSGICYPEAPLRMFFAEVLLAAGGIGTILIWPPVSVLAVGLTCWLFFLVQSLYFFVLPGASDTNRERNLPDKFEQISREMERLLAGRDVSVS